MMSTIKKGFTTELWDLWFSELHNRHVGMTYKIKRILFSGESRFQRIDVFDTYEYGKMLVLYGSVMLTERDEFVYHEMISHVPMFVHPDPKEVLIIGGGDGGTLREVIRHREVNSVTLVEIDEEVVEVSKKFIPQTAKSFETDKLTLVFEDGARFVKETEKKFDVIIVDSPDPIAPADTLFKEEFFKDAKNCLKDGGIFVAQTESPFYHKKIVQEVYLVLKSLFKITKMFCAWVPTYPSALWSFSFCSDKLHPISNFDENKYKELNLETKYYNSEIHKAAFALPNFVKEIIE